MIQHTKLLQAVLLLFYCPVISNSNSSDTFLIWFMQDEIGDLGDYTETTDNETAIKGTWKHNASNWRIVVSWVSAHSLMSAQEIALAVWMESTHSRISAQARSLQSHMASAQAASPCQYAKGCLHPGTFSDRDQVTITIMIVHWLHPLICIGNHMNSSAIWEIIAWVMY